MERKEYVRECLYGIYYYRDPEKTIYHRERGLPACKSTEEYESYLENNRCHRLDGLAVDCQYDKRHSLNGKQLFPVYKI